MWIQWHSICRCSTRQLKKGSIVWPIRKKKAYKTCNSHKNFLSNQIIPSWPVRVCLAPPVWGCSTAKWGNETESVRGTIPVESLRRGKGNWKLTDIYVTPVPLNISLFNTRCQRIGLEVSVIWRFHITSCFNMLCLYWALTHFVIWKASYCLFSVLDYVGFREFQHFHMSKYVLFL